MCDLYQRSNWVISDFRVCDSETLDRLHMTYCMHMYGCELWDLSSNYIEKFKTAWRKVKRRIWRLKYRAHNAIMHNISNNIYFQIDFRILKFIHTSLNHSNVVCSSLLASKLLCKNSVFARNYRQLSYKFGIMEHEWLSDLHYLLGKVKMKISQYEPCAEGQITRELCNIRDGTMIYVSLNYGAVCN